MPRKSKKIEEIHAVFEEYGIETIENISIEALIDLRNTLDSLEDKVRTLYRTSAIRYHPNRFIRHNGKRG